MNSSILKDFVPEISSSLRSLSSTTSICDRIIAEAVSKVMKRMYLTDIGNFEQVLVVEGLL